MAIFNQSVSDDGNGKEITYKLRETLEINAQSFLDKNNTKRKNPSSIATIR